jgi:hypothetical protein
MMMKRGSSNNGEFSIAFVNGTIKFTSEEGALYARLFHIVCIITKCSNSFLYFRDIFSHTNMYTGGCKC